MKNSSGWYIHPVEEGQDPCGPIGLDIILNRVELGLLSKDTLIWSEGMDDWYSIESLSPDLSKDASSRGSSALGFALTLVGGGAAATIGFLAGIHAPHEVEDAAPIKIEPEIQVERVIETIETIIPESPYDAAQRMRDADLVRYINWLLELADERKVLFNTHESNRSDTELTGADIQPPVPDLVLHKVVQSLVKEFASDPQVSLEGEPELVASSDYGFYCYLVRVVYHGDDPQSYLTVFHTDGNRRFNYFPAHAFIPITEPISESALEHAKKSNKWVEEVESGGDGDENHDE